MPHLFLATPALAQGEQAGIQGYPAMPSHAGGVRLAHKGHQRLQSRSDDCRVRRRKQARQVLRGQCKQVCLSYLDLPQIGKTHKAGPV